MCDLLLNLEWLPGDSVPNVLAFAPFLPTSFFYFIELLGCIVLSF